MFWLSKHIVNILHSSVDVLAFVFADLQVALRNELGSQIEGVFAKMKNMK